MINGWLKWSALVLTIAGAVCNSLNIYPLNIFLCNLGCILYLIWSVRIRELNLILVNAGLLLIYALGVVYLYW